MSINPGTTHFPEASTTSAPEGAASPLPSSLTTPFSTRTSMTSSRPWVGSITLPPFISKFIWSPHYEYFDNNSLERSILCKVKEDERRRGGVAALRRTRNREN